MLPDVKSLSMSDAVETEETAIEKVNQGYTVLNDCLDWISTQKKLKIAKRARDVVQEHQDYYLPILEIDDYTNLPGTRNTIVLAVMANRPKEDSETDPLEDEIEFCRTMRAAGFLVQIPWQMSSHCSQWDFHARGRLMCWCENVKEVDNHCLQASELTRTGKVPEATLNTEIVAIQSVEETEKFDQMRVNAATRSAQKGGEVWSVLFKSLFTNSKLLSPHARPLLSPGDQCILIDMHLHSGDHALGACVMMDNMVQGVTCRNVMVKMKDKKSHAAVQWTSKRLGSFLCGKWLRHECKLMGKDGSIIPPLETEVTVLDETDKSYLRTAGAWEAYEGARSWESKLKACSISGAQVKIMPSILAEFATAPPSVKDLLAQTEKKHNDQYAAILQGRLLEQSSSNAPISDPRPAPTNEDTGATQAIELPGPENETVLRGQIKVAADVKSFDMRSLNVIVDEQGHAWLLLGAKEQGQIIKKGSKLAGLGAGKVVKLDDSNSAAAVHVTFPQQDKTLVEAVLSGDGNEDNDAKVKKGSFYVVAKEALKAQPAEKLFVTGHDITIRPVGTEGQSHGFDIKRSENWGFVMKGKEVTSYVPGNAARLIVQHKVQLHSSVGWVWRYVFDKVHVKLTAKKPFLVTVEDVKMTPGKPVKITQST
ncbi:unnamed protein product [Durusdinium trenchii]|uniref:Uncharacterized protein n=1 Tax=Durusdinium trenchii TaxID=1381693 RepID=A0ABP0SPB7_9DINO